MTDYRGRVADDREILLARVDELTGIVAALVRAMEETRQGRPGSATSGLTLESIVGFLNSVGTDLAYLRGMADVNHHRAIAFQRQAVTAQAALAQAQATVLELQLEITALNDRVASGEAVAAEWANECARLRLARDVLAQHVVTLQGGRWMRLGRALGVGRRARRP